MHTEAGEQHGKPINPAGMRANFGWILAGNVLNAAAQWAVLSLLAKLGGSRMLGEYAYGLAVAMPIAMLAHLNLRAVLATDVGSARGRLGDYLSVRFAASFAGIVAITVAAAILASSRTQFAVMVVLGIALAVEAVSDLYYGAMQRRERMDQIGRSMILRALSTVIAVGFTLKLTGGLVAAVTALAAARLAVLLLYDRPQGRRGEILQAAGRPVQRIILSRALPLGAVLMLVSLNANLPRYAIEHIQGAQGLAAYAAAASFITVGTTVVTALGQAVTSRLARAFEARDWRAFRKGALQVTGATLLVGVAGVLTSVALGPLVLALLYRPEYAAHASLLTALMAAGLLLYTGSMLGYVATSTRSFGPQLPLLVAAAATTAVASTVLVPRMGLAGGAAAIALAALVQISGQLWIIRSAVRKAR